MIDCSNPRQVMLHTNNLLSLIRPFSHRDKQEQGQESYLSCVPSEKAFGACSKSSWLWVNAVNNSQYKALILKAEL